MGYLGMNSKLKASVHWRTRGQYFSRPEWATANQIASFQCLSMRSYQFARPNSLKWWPACRHYFTLSRLSPPHTSYCRETPDFLSETNLFDFLAHQKLANFLSPIFCRVNTSRMLDSGSKYHMMEITLFHWFLFRQIVGDHCTTHWTTRFVRTSENQTWLIFPRQDPISSSLSEAPHISRSPDKKSAIVWWALGVLVHNIL